MSSSPIQSGETASPTTTDGASATEDASESIDRDDLFHILRNRRRRFALHYLKRHDGVTDLGDLATQVAAWENEIPVDEVTSDQRRRVYNALQQTHVPELKDTGIVEVDRHEIELTDRIEEFDIYLEVVPGKDIPWSEYFLALGAVSLAGLVVVWLNVGPFALVPGVAAGVFATVAFLVSAGANYYYQHERLIGEHERPPELRTD